MNLQAANQALKIRALMHQGTQINQARVEAWAATLDPDMPPTEARSLALQWYRNNNGWMEPADLNRLWRALKRERLNLFQMPQPPAEIACDPVAYAEYEAEWRKQIIQGATPGTAALTALAAPKQIGGNHGQ
ncbi:MAG: hypothetical protein SPK50_03020 [Mobiluncus porci]|uniref:hypothetical protein n=1 Tax=Mobiluncus porci TaxID=2652278 RepID=UPI0023EF9D92|nr:hypothetical protein [Mobiluncus porci]MDD7541200.1 hypothetical protein [Mobiluncus porci]MDY5748089.1 hypothetical protein [Mobiluncus porci]